MNDYYFVEYSILSTNKEHPQHKEINEKLNQPILVIYDMNNPDVAYSISSDLLLDENIKTEQLSNTITKYTKKPSTQGNMVVEISCYLQFLTDGLKRELNDNSIDWVEKETKPLKELKEDMFQEIIEVIKKPKKTEQKTFGQ